MTLVVESWEKVMAIGDNYDEVAGELLFKRIFDINPAATAFFKFTDGFGSTDEAIYRTEQFKKHSTGVIRAVTKAVTLLKTGNMDELVEVLQMLGAAHAPLNLEKAHYDLVGQALLETLAAALGDAFTPETKEAWAGVYGVITDNMMKGAAEVKN